MSRIVPFRKPRARLRGRRARSGSARVGAGLWPLAVIAIGLFALGLWESGLTGARNITDGVGVIVNKGVGRAGDPGVAGRVVAGRVSHVRDGDTIEVAGVPVRFGDLDCAELGTQAGQRAKREMQALVRGSRVSCELTGARSYDRVIGICRLEDGRSLSDAMRARAVCRF